MVLHSSKYNFCLVLMACSLAGLAIAPKIQYHFILFIGFYIVFMMAVTKKISAIICLAALAGLLLGFWRGQAINQQLNEYNSLYNQSVIVFGTVTDDPYYNDRKQIEFHISKLQYQGDELRGRIRVSTFGGSNLKRGDRIQVSGKLREGFANRQGFMYYADFEILTHKNTFLENLRLKYFASINTILPEPQSSLGLGFLVGLRTVLPDDLLRQLSATGLTHIVAVSGYNLTVIVRTIRRMSSKYSKFLTIFLSGSLILIFLNLTGLAPSVFRASVVCFISLAAWYYGRQVHPMSLLIASAFISAFIKPEFLWYDIGWWLSFLAFFGVLIFAPIFTARFFKRPPGFFKQIIIETFSAQLFALPLIVLIFGELSLISIVANAIILPTIPLAMLFTFLAGICQMLFPPIAGWVAYPAKLILTFITDSVELMSKAPYALIDVSIDRFIFLMLMSLLLFATYKMYRTTNINLLDVNVVK